MRLHVAGIPKGKTLVDLVEAFGPYKPFSAMLAIDRESGRCRGFGFVEMDDDLAKNAIQDMNGNSWDGSSITVQQARPREHRGGR